jgi:hypothetical protein
MQIIEPYMSLDEAREALDNGGRFYNLLSDADDERITSGELAKAAGVFRTSVNAFLYLDMALAALASEERNEIINLLDESLRARYEAESPLQIDAARLDAEGEINGAVIVEGYLKFYTDQKSFKGTTIVPMMVGKVVVPVTVPVNKQFNLYTLSSAAGGAAFDTLTATPHDTELLHDGRVRLGGIIRQAQFSGEENPAHQNYLETLYYTYI